MLKTNIKTFLNSAKSHFKYIFIKMHIVVQIVYFENKNRSVILTTS